jgi:hypothetical protein
MGGEGGADESEGIYDAYTYTDLPYEDWEVPELRMHMPRELQWELKAAVAIVAVSRRKLGVMEAEHPADREYFGKMNDVIQNYELWGVSRSSDQAIELYKQLNGIWFTVVIFKQSEHTRLNSVGTMHRIARRKVESRRRSYLRERGR